jgi:hypothetical protein
MTLLEEKKEFYTPSIYKHKQLFFSLSELNLQDLTLSFMDIS